MPLTCRDATCRVLVFAFPLQLRGTPRPYIFGVYLFLHQDAGIDGDDVFLIGEQRVDVHLLDFRGEAE